MEELSHPEEEYPTISLRRGIEALRDLLAGCQRIAVIGMDAVAHPVWQRLIQPLEGDGRELASGDAVPTSCARSRRAPSWT